MTKSSLASARIAAETLAARCDTAYDVFGIAAEMHPDLPFLCIPKRQGRDCYPDGFEITDGAASVKAYDRIERLQAVGYGPGRRMTLMLDSRPAHILTQLALYALGATQVPVNPDYLDQELSYLLEHSEADLGLGLPHNITEVRRVAAAVGNPAVLEASNAPLPVLHESARQTETARQSEVALIYTSGTTGRPKGCVIDHEYHHAQP
jgi:crotonobetaine/carnitine-CoA ligase